VFRKEVSLQGPLENRDGKLVIAIALDVGGRTLSQYTKGIGTVEGNQLVVEIQPWLAQKLNVQEGSLVIVDNHNGKFTITRSADND
jgi:predicted molibdopterin-dependent oxidoreductase YjgC